ncbi:MAG: hypothetical protein QG577_2142, partial [Thermodesulfobacteriota bacterium]|nr:hypothetical protein [Thermodesulfobacteriota bacterium]
VAFNDTTDWHNASRATRISYHSYEGLIGAIDVQDFHVVHATSFRIFRNRMRFLNRLEKYTWYGALTKYLTTRYPQISSDLMVVALKGETRSEESSKH